MIDKGSKILVLGAGGLVGSALVEELRLQGYRNILTPTRGYLDVSDPVVTRWYFSVFRPEYVFFCAAKVGGIADNAANKLAFLEDNLKMELNVLAKAAAYDIQKLLFVSTSCVYPRDCRQPMRPEDIWSGKLEPTTEAYSVAKLAAMKLCEYHHEQGRNFISVIPCNIFGERDSFDPETAHCLPGMMARMHAAKMANEPVFRVWGHPDTQREFIFAPDLARGLITAMEHYDDKEPLNLGSGIELRMEELAIILAEVIGYEGVIEFDSGRPSGTPRKLLDSARATALGWRPHTPFFEAVQKTYAWFLRSQH